jgi:magnesium chelatase family protein
MAVRAIQAFRFAGLGSGMSNAPMGAALRNRYCALDRAGSSILRMAMNRLGLSARAYDRILRLARTIADLEESEHICPSHVTEAVNYRHLDREGWSG